MTLPKDQLRALRSKAHNLTAAIKIGKGGLTDGIVDAVDARLRREGLVKVGTGDAGAEAVAEALATRLSAEVVQVIGNTCTVWRTPDDA